MYVVCVSVREKESFIEPFIEATLDNARHTRREPGNVRFDVLRSQDDDGRFFLYEVYRTAEDFEAHHRSEHYLRWRQAVTDWMAEPRQAAKFETLFFDDGDA